jgi:hypothetical protein
MVADGLRAVWCEGESESKATHPFVSVSIAMVSVSGSDAALRSSGTVSKADEVITAIRP